MRQPQRVAAAIGDFRFVVVHGCKVALVTELLNERVVFVEIEVPAGSPGLLLRSFIHSHGPHKYS